MSDLERAKEIAALLTDAQKRAIQPCATNRADAGLLKLGLACWSTRPGHKYPSLKITNLGHSVRRILEDKNGQD